MSDTQYGEKLAGKGSTPPPLVNPLWKSAKMRLGSVSDYLQLNNNSTHSYFRYLTFSGKNIKIRPPVKIWPSPQKSINFTHKHVRNNISHYKLQRRYAYYTNVCRTALDNIPTWMHPRNTMELQVCCLDFDRSCSPVPHSGSIHYCTRYSREGSSSLMTSRSPDLDILNRYPLADIPDILGFMKIRIGSTICRVENSYKGNDCMVGRHCSIQAELALKVSLTSSTIEARHNMPETIAACADLVKSCHCIQAVCN